MSLNSRSPARETRALPIRLPRQVRDHGMFCSSLSGRDLLVNGWQVLYEWEWIALRVDINCFVSGQEWFCECL